MPHPFKEKDEVFVRSLQKLGQVVGIVRAGWCEVLIGGVRVRCRVSDLCPKEQLDAKALKLLARLVKPRVGDKKPVARPMAPVDLHGLRVLEAVQAVESAVNAALMQGQSRLEVVHGIGTGRVRAAVHKYLSELPVVERFEVDAQNAGVTWVYF